MAEKMLIQRISPFVPLHHIKNGTMGITGHVCSFETDLEGFVDSLPRLESDVSMIRVLRRMKQEIGRSEGDITKAYRVRRSKVLLALKWLKTCNPFYRNINIIESNLNWIGDRDEATLQCHEIQSDATDTPPDGSTNNADLGPAPLQGITPQETNGDNIRAFGYVDTGGKAALSQDDQTINTSIRNTLETCKKRKEVTVDWPATKDNPVNEFSDKRIFVNAFPWLFPGGKGDMKDFEGTPGACIFPL